MYVYVSQGIAQQCGFAKFAEKKIDGIFPILLFDGRVAMS